MQIRQAISCQRKYWHNIFEWPSLSAPLAKSPKHILFENYSELLLLTLALTYFGSFLFCFMSFYQLAVCVWETHVMYCDGH